MTRIGYLLFYCDGGSTYDHYKVVFDKAAAEAWVAENRPDFSRGEFGGNFYEEVEVVED
jgi:hypothetical protein